MTHPSYSPVDVNQYPPKHYRRCVVASAFLGLILAIFVLAIGNRVRPTSIVESSALSDQIFEWNPGPLCHKGDGKGFYPFLKEYCTNTKVWQIKDSTGGEYTVDMCASINSNKYDDQGYIDRMAGPCADDEFDIGAGCSRGEYYCLSGDYCMLNSVIKHYKHNFCCGKTAENTLQCYRGYHAVSIGRFTWSECPSYHRSWLHPFKVCPCQVCGTNSHLYNQTSLTGAVAEERRLMPADTPCYVDSGQLCGLMVPCSNVSGLGMLNWFCNRGKPDTYKGSDYVNDVPYIAKWKLDQVAPVYRVEHPLDYNLSNVSNIQAYAIDPNQKYVCEPCASFHGTEYMDGGRKATFDAFSSKHMNKWCSIQWDNNLHEFPGLGCDQYDYDVDCTTGKDCCTPCPSSPEFDVDIGKLGWMCKKGTRIPCVNSNWVSVLNRRAVKLLKDGITYLYPILGVVIQKKSCSEMLWCKIVKFTAVTLITAIPGIGPEAEVVESVIALEEVGEKVTDPIALAVKDMAEFATRADPTLPWDQAYAKFEEEVLEELDGGFYSRDLPTTDDMPGIGKRYQKPGDIPQETIDKVKDLEYRDKMEWMMETSKVNIYNKQYFEDLFGRVFGKGCEEHLVKYAMWKFLPWPEYKTLNYADFARAMDSNRPPGSMIRDMIQQADKKHVPFDAC